MKLGRLNHVGVATPSIDISIAHYRDTMRAEVVREAPGSRKLRDKRLENPWKKHDNIPL